MEKVKDKDAGKIVGLLQILIIVELGKLGIPQLEIRKIVGVDIHKISRILKHLSKK